MREETRRVDGQADAAGWADLQSRARRLWTRPAEQQQQHCCRPATQPRLLALFPTLSIPTYAFYLSRTRH